MHRARRADEHRPDPVELFGIQAAEAQPGAENQARLMRRIRRIRRRAPLLVFADSCICGFPHFLESVVAGLERPIVEFEE